MQSYLKYTGLLAFLILSLVMTSCTDDDIDPQKPELNVPTTYNFENVSYSGQTQRLDMFTELKNYMKTSRTGEKLDEALLLAMYANSPDATWEKTYDASKQLKSKTLESVQTDFDALLVALAAASQSDLPGSEGQAGVVTSLNGASNYLLGADGLDHAQIFEKGLMGACLFYQATSVYFGDDRMNVDNTTINPGEGTDMEHHWDEAFGYFGVGPDFPSNTDGVVFWGSYSTQRDAILGSNKKVMDALLKGRAAISQDFLGDRDDAITETRTNWELIAVGSALHYINRSIADFDDMAIRGHLLSEAIGFIYALQFNPDKKVTNTQVAEMLELVAGSSDFASMNLYQAEISKLNQTKDLLAGYYDLNSQKDDF